MNWNLIVIFSYQFYLLLNAPELIHTATEDGRLELLHVLFRHGNRTPDPEELYPKDPYLNATYGIVGHGELTNAGKRREYQVGRALREKYNHFLGEYYTPWAVEPRSTAVNRTKMSLLLVLDSLYPPKGEQLWTPNATWQPIPYNYVPPPEDKILSGVSCPYYITLYNNYSNSPEMEARYAPYHPLFDYISNNTGLNVTKFHDVLLLSGGLQAEEDWGFTLPNWTKPVWPKIMSDVGVQDFFVATGTMDMRRMASGYFLQKVIDDTMTKINGTTSDKTIYLYSAHDDNIADLLITLDIFDKAVRPNYGAYVVFEVRRVNGTYGFMIYYQNYEEAEPQLMQLPGCDTFCDIDNFIDLTKKYIPTPDLCYKNNTDT